MVERTNRSIRTISYDVEICRSLDIQGICHIETTGDWECREKEHQDGTDKRDAGAAEVWSRCGHCAEESVDGAEADVLRERNRATASAATVSRRGASWLA